MISDHMVLPSGADIPLWGDAIDEKTVQVAFMSDDGKVYLSDEASVSASGEWLCRFPKVEPGLTGKLIFKGSSDERLEVLDVVTGEVWLAAGQSNMLYTIGRKEAPEINKTAAAEQAEQLKPQIRFFKVASSKPSSPLKQVRGSWKVMDAEIVQTMSAVGWHFAATLNEHLKTPVGVIVAAWGGTPIEAWAPRSKLESDPVGLNVLSRQSRLDASYPDRIAKYEKELAEWESANPTPALQHENRRSKPKKPYVMADSHVPCRLYNGMIHPIAPFAIKGAIWYQGENNAYRPSEYDELIHHLVNGWRERWGYTFPFYYVELANLYPKQVEPVEIERQPGDGVPSWAYIRETQAAILDLPNTGVATAVDVGEAGDIHPADKKSVGVRLGNLALVEVYQKNLPSPYSPSFSHFDIEGATLRLHIDHADGLRLRGDNLDGFAIKGAEGDWAWAEGSISGDEILLRNDSIGEPVAVRYGWATNPILSVENSTGLPLRPFRSDRDSGEWEGFVKIEQ
ncbi:sialate O-acetylesterase [Coraliomargarita sp. SDUM461004]|uniref:Sialate O-acetylesterase n=1 Tax=Thalassobacterium sedimentorum TaxID=3041258 RepID=A0ABU1AGY6_9BACT|nr:sialate O-acetylesterase [Coraliomargarita sp. SDUM461004]MDQ8194056.1 sialate O-acetylesterase [Coraliomargarita sp. SDUM461004]